MLSIKTSPHLVQSGVALSLRLFGVLIAQRKTHWIIFWPGGFVFRSQLLNILNAHLQVWSIEVVEQDDAAHIGCLPWMSRKSLDIIRQVNYLILLVMFK